MDSTGREKLRLRVKIPKEATVYGRNSEVLENEMHGYGMFNFFFIQIVGSEKILIRIVFQNGCKDTGKGTQQSRNVKKLYNKLHLTKMAFQRHFFPVKMES